MSESEETNTKTPQIFLKLSSPKHAPASHFMPSPREKRGGGAFRLQWLREEARAHDVGDMGRALRRIASGPNVVPWAAGNLLPALGMSRWRVRVDVSHDDEGDMLIGVCDAVGRNAWGLCLRSGKLNRVHRFAAHEAAQKRLKGLQALVVPPPPVPAPSPAPTPAAPLPGADDPRGPAGLNWMRVDWNTKPAEGKKPLTSPGLSKALASGKHTFTPSEILALNIDGLAWDSFIEAGGVRYRPAVPWPDGDLTQVLKDASGEPADLRGRATGREIEVVVNHDEGTLSFAIDGGPGMLALSGVARFPEGAELRPWALLLQPQDRVSFVRPYM